MERKIATLSEKADDSSVPAPALTSHDVESRLQLEMVLEAEIAVRQHLQRELALRNCAMDAASSHFMILDMQRPGWPIVYVNRSILKDFGYQPGEVIGRSAADFIATEMCPVQMEQINEAIAAGREARTELRGRRKDGSVFWAGIFMGPVRDVSGVVTHYLLIGADITTRLAEEQNKRKLMDQLYSEMQERERMSLELHVARKLESVGRLASGIAHEINTPIQYVGDSVHFLQSAVTDLENLVSAYRGAFHALSDSTPPAEVLARIREFEGGVDMEFLSVEVPKAFERTLEGVGRVAGIVRAMKEFAHPDASEQSPGDLNHAIETTLTVALNEYKYLAAVETRFDALPEVMCHISEINQVFLNLVVNAAHAIEESGQDVTTGRIEIVTSAGTDYVTVTVTDNGCGIPAENFEKIFDPFFTTKDVGKGTGQGLAIARSIIIEKHGGHIDVQSQPGKGTKFILRLPIAGRPKGTSA